MAKCPSCGAYPYQPSLGACWRCGFDAAKVAVASNPRIWGAADYAKVEADLAADRAAGVTGVAYPVDDLDDIEAPRPVPEYQFNESRGMFEKRREAPVEVVQ